MIAIVRLPGLVGRLMVRPLLFTSLIAVLCTVICPTARGDILFTTYVSSSDLYTAPSSIGPVPNALTVPYDFSGDVYYPPYNASVPYAATTTTVSEITAELNKKTKTVYVGSLYSTGEVSGYESVDVFARMKFKMTIAETQPLPSYAPPNPPITFRFHPNLEVYVGTQDWIYYNPITEQYIYVPATQGTASASIQIHDSKNPFSTGFWALDKVSLQSEGDTFISPVEYLKTYEGDDVVVTAETEITMAGNVYPSFYYDAKTNSWVLTGYGGNLETVSSAYVDPQFAFDQPAFDALMGPNTFTLADYYEFDFSPNIPIQVVPEPCTMLLLGSGLIGLAGLFRKFKK